MKSILAAGITGVAINNSLFRAIFNSLVFQFLNGAKRLISDMMDELKNEQEGKAWNNVKKFSFSKLRKLIKTFRPSEHQCYCLTTS